MTEIIGTIEEGRDNLPVPKNQKNAENRCEGQGHSARSTADVDTVPAKESRFIAATRGIVSLLFPSTCGVCGGDLTHGVRGLCSGCRSRFTQWVGFSCRVCGIPLPDGGARCHTCRQRRRSFRFCRSAGLYEGTLRKAILLFKYGGREEMAGPLSLCLAETFRSRPELRSAECVVPVPLHFVKHHARGFNQSELLAKGLTALLGLPLELNSLKRRRWTRAQAGLGKETRKGNVAGAFEVKRPDSIRGRRVLLVDDVCTTGATLDACSRTLRDAGATRVDALTLARDVETAFHVQRARGGT
jgi:ComF family protein